LESNYRGFNAQAAFNVDAKRPFCGQFQFRCRIEGAVEDLVVIQGIQSFRQFTPF
jgi:hypothetical protein